MVIVSKMRSNDFQDIGRKFTRLTFFLKTTLGPAYDQFSYNEHPATISRFLCIKIIDCNVKKFSYNEHPLITSSFFLNIFLGVKKFLIAAEEK